MTRPLCILIKGTHTERKGNAVTGLNSNEYLLLVLPLLTMVLQNRFADIEALSEPQNEALFEILNPEDVFAITHRDRGGSGTQIIGHTDGSLRSPPHVRNLGPRTPPYPCV